MQERSCSEDRWKGRKKRGLVTPEKLSTGTLVLQQALWATSNPQEETLNMKALPVHSGNPWAELHSEVSWRICISTAAKSGPSLLSKHVWCPACHWRVAAYQTRGLMWPVLLLCSACFVFRSKSSGVEGWPGFSSQPDVAAHGSASPCCCPFSQGAAGQLLAQDSNRAGPEAGLNQNPEFLWNGRSVPHQLF